MKNIKLKPLITESHSSIKDFNAKMIRKVTNSGLSEREEWVRFIEILEAQERGQKYKY